MLVSGGRSEGVRADLGETPSFHIVRVRTMAFVRFGIFCIPAKLRLSSAYSFGNLPDYLFEKLAIMPIEHSFI